MSIKVKNSELSNETITALNSLIDTDINATCAFRLTRIIKELSSIVDDKAKLEKKLIEKYTQKDEEGNPTQVLNEDGTVVGGAVNITSPEQFQGEMADLMEIENEIPYDKINFEDLKLETAKVKDLITLEFLFV
jgi:mannose-6-phosphate isomerase class I